MPRLSPRPGERIETATELEFRTAGAESNVAVTAARLGVDSAWLSKLPESPLGRKVTTSLEQHGVRTDTLDPIGTGDAFVGGFLASRIRGNDVAAALDYGAATTTLKRTMHGDVAVVTPAEVEAIRERGSGGIQR